MVIQTCRLINRANEIEEHLYSVYLTPGEIVAMMGLSSWLLSSGTFDDYLMGHAIYKKLLLAYFETDEFKRGELLVRPENE